MNKKNDIRIDTTLIHPWLKYKLTKLLEKCNEQGIYLIITEGFRTVEYQDKLYAQGRTTKGSIVTYAKGSDYSSQHQWGIAFDIAINDSNHLYDLNYIQKVAEIAKSIGLGWGGDWTDFKDYPHFYLKKWGSTTTILKVLYRTSDKFKKTWYAKVNRKNGLNIWNKTKKKKKKLVKNGKQVSVFYKHLIWTKVEYDGVVGFMRTKYLK